MNAVDPVESAAPIAHIHGQPLLEVPQDLYIPPDALELVLENFQGPLDLLLYLIRKHNLDVLDIPMVALTEQYLGYIELMCHNRMELAAEYLLMAAMLIEIKSRMLLPPTPKSDEDDEVEDPRAELMRRLLEYEQIKLAALELSQLPLSGRDFEPAQALLERSIEPLLPEVTVADLRQAWLSILGRAKLKKHHVVKREQLSVREQMIHILQCLNGDDYVAFEQLFELDDGIPKLVVTFIAILELAKEYLLEIQQRESFGQIYVRRHGAANSTLCEE